MDRKKHYKISFGRCFVGEDSTWLRVWIPTEGKENILLANPFDGLCPTLGRRECCVSTGHSVFMCREVPGETGTCLTKVLLVTGGTRSSMPIFQEGED